MKTNKSRVILQIGVFVTLIIFAVLYITTAIAHDNSPKNPSYKNAFVKGSISVDGGDWLEYNEPSDFKNHFYKKVVVKGKLTERPADNQNVILFAQNVWVDVKSGGDEVISTNRVKDQPVAGYSVIMIPAALISNNGDIVIEMENNYPIYAIAGYENVLDSIIIGTEGSLYDEMFNHHMFEILLSLTICFLGLFGFSFAGVLFKEKSYQYFAFATVAFFGGLYVLTDSIYKYMPLWIENPILCEVLDISSGFLLLVASSFYLRASFSNNKAKMYMTVVTIMSIVVAVLAALFQIFGVLPITLSELMQYLPFLLTAIGGVVFLILEVFKWKNPNARFVLLSCTPVILAASVEAVNTYLEFTPSRSIMKIGLLITVLIQLASLTIETKKHYEEMLKVQEMQNELLQARVSIMVSQIQPHFMFNSLTSIAMLCEKNPATAKKATIEFAEYLRGNMNSLKQKNPVEFETELKHLKTYISLEKMRFGDDLNIVYDIQATDFLIPLLSVQPLVENAVKHGVGMLEDGGTVTISTREYDDRYEIVVSDDGVGFDVNKAFNDGRTHVGIENVKSRLDSMCHGTLTIESEKGKGTRSTIKIPKEDV